MGGIGIVVGMLMEEEDEFGGKKQRNTSVVEKVRIKDGYMVEGRRDGGVGVWTC